MPEQRTHSATVAEPTSDERLLEMFLSGDEGAFVKLYERFAKGILTYLRTILREHGDVADDLFQETFVRLFRERSKRAMVGGDGSYTPIKNTRAWLFRVAHNLAISHLRTIHLTVSLSSDDPDESRWDERLMVPVEESFATLFGEGDGLAAEDLQEKFRACVDLLPRSLREVYVLRELNGLEYDQVAEIVGCSADAARMRISRARGVLRKALEKYL